MNSIAVRQQYNHTRILYFILSFKKASTRVGVILHHKFGDGCMYIHIQMLYIRCIEMHYMQACSTNTLKINWMSTRTRNANKQMHAIKTQMCASLNASTRWRVNIDGKTIKRVHAWDVWACKHVTAQTRDAQPAHVQTRKRRHATKHANVNTWKRKNVCRYKRKTRGRADA